MALVEQMKELRSFSKNELELKKIDLLKDQFNLRMQKGTGQLKQNHFFKKNRRDIARINTLLSEGRYLQ